ncbi:copper resistance protein NlpE N-terminal domain-containing protein [Mongoliitalea daihaiensis]|uniref:copper resistance protein NlpE N-terminal domain-containing protein n=1 Tax=Mongoliitalea daihaiensis TaxID=2782006 RepID=UPI001F165BF3|nr:copper resistance protein NlpE N-terminal domain-containing protein [Mongoliitalea daihaiensis]UJP63708.1 copper resistance protein NlpE N-terminal domain-containing protein [Mongoliitalea daihaiensis]
MKKTSIVAMICLLMSACQSEKSTVETSEDMTFAMGDNSRSSVDWNGTYKGTLPCADCAGIETKIIIKSDETFERSMKYLGKEDDLFFDQGTFEWDDLGRTITLTNESDEKQSYQVGENILFQLDQDGNRITGDLAEMYTLVKNFTDYELENKKWILIELRGTPYEKRSDDKEAFLFFDNETSRFYGNTGCNSINGGYELQDGYRITFGNVASTMMACPSLENDQIIGSLLKEVDNYSIGDDQLSLNKARMAPLARFQLVEEE